MREKLTKDVFTTYETARILSTTDSSVKRWIQSGLLQAYKTPGGHRRIPKPALEKFIADNNIPVRKQKIETKRILIVDDHEEIRDLIENILNEHDTRFEIAKASDGFGAGKLVAQFKPDLVILDLMMPGLNGFSVCRDIKMSRDTKHIGVLIVTGYATEENIARATKCGADTILKKPIQPSQLQFAVDALLEQEHVVSELHADRMNVQMR